MNAPWIQIERPSAELMRTVMPHALAWQLAWRAMAADFLEAWQDAGSPSLYYGATKREVSP